MRKYCFSSILSSTLLALFLLVLLQSSYSDAKDKTTLILPEEEVSALKDVVMSLNVQPLPDYSKASCYDQSNGIDCNCREPGSTVTVCQNDSSSTDQTTVPQISCESITTCHVRAIYLSGRELSNRTIPSTLAKLTYLEHLSLSNNLLVGPIPKELGSLKRLKYLFLFKNNLNGKIPKELGGLSSLLYMDIGANTLTGKIPEELGDIVSLRYLFLASNRLHGKVPAKLGQLINLRTLSLADNAFTEALPEEFAQLSRMQDFNVMGNSFSGPIPEFIGKWKWLAKLQLLGNNFEGPLPEALSSLTNLRYLMINDLIDTSGQGSPFPNISQLKHLRILILRKCSITGEIHKDIGQMSSLTYIDLSFNKMTGEIPKNINQLQINTIYLTGNNFNGSIPSWAERWKKINADFSHNNFSEVNFKYFKNMSSNLNLYACCSSTIPNLDFEWEKTNFSCIDQEKPKHTHLFINCGGENKSVNDKFYEADLSKGGPSTIYFSKDEKWAYSSTGKFLGSGGGPMDYVQETSCLDIDDAPLYTTARISPMSLKYYGLCLKNDNYTVKLYFNEIVFTNDYDYGNNGNRVFDVFIQGKNVLKDFDIKKEAGGPRKAVIKNFTAHVENNVLEIHFYWAGKGSIYIPPGIYGPLVSAISVTPDLRSPKKKLTTGQIVGIAGSTVFVMVLLLAFLKQMGCLGEKLYDAGSMSPFGPYNFQQLKEATQNFSPANKIGKGGFGQVYRGDCKGEVIAVKQLLSNSKEQKKGFLNEVLIVSELNHPNLVKLLGCCWDHQNNQFLLVYEFMENNSLSSALFGTGNLKSRLNWETRFEICLGIAKGLAFLHEDVKIIHRDIKPTNVLLDKDLKAKISDFGLAKHHEEEHAHVTKVGGTSCYVAPEYAMRGHLTHKADVYSFGVVMLEILSGKASTDYRPNDETVFLLDLAYVLYQKGNLLELMDPDLKMDYKVNQAKRVLNLAMLCTNPAPAVRPKMLEVVDVLEGKTEPKSFPVDAPYSDDGFRKASASAELSRSTHSGSTSRDGTSDSFLSYSTSKEGNFDTPLPTPLQSISDENANTAKNKVE